MWDKVVYIAIDSHNYTKWGTGKGRAQVRQRWDVSFQVVPKTEERKYAGGSCHQQPPALDFDKENKIISNSPTVTDLTSAHQRRHNSRTIALVPMRYALVSTPVAYSN